MGMGAGGYSEFKKQVKKKKDQNESYIDGIDARISRLLKGLLMGDYELGAKNEFCEGVIGKLVVCCCSK